MEKEQEDEGRGRRDEQLTFKARKEGGVWFEGQVREGHCQEDKVQTPHIVVLLALVWCVGE